MNNEPHPTESQKPAEYIDPLKLLEIGQNVTSFARGGIIRDARRLDGGIYYTSGEKAGQLIGLDPHPEDSLKEQP